MPYITALNNAVLRHNRIIQLFISQTLPLSTHVVRITSPQRTVLCKTTGKASNTPSPYRVSSKEMEVSKDACALMF